MAKRKRSSTSVNPPAKNNTPNQQGFVIPATMQSQSQNLTGPAEGIALVHGTLSEESQKETISLLRLKESNKENEKARHFKAFVINKVIAVLVLLASFVFLSWVIWLFVENQKWDLITNIAVSLVSLVAGWLSGSGYTKSKGH